MSTYHRRDAVRYFREKMEFTAGPAELDHMIKDHEDIVIVDVRRPEDYVKSHIPRAINLPREQWPTLAGLELEKRNVVYCYTQQCHLATDACLTFAQKGFRVVELEGGFRAWEESNLAVEGEPALSRAA